MAHSPHHIGVKTLDLKKNTNPPISPVFLSVSSIPTVPLTENTDRATLNGISNVAKNRRFCRRMSQGVRERPALLAQPPCPRRQPAPYCKQVCQGWTTGRERSTPARSGEEGWVWGRTVGVDRRYRFPLPVELYKGELSGSKPTRGRKFGCFYFPPDETDGKKKQPTSRVIHDRNQQRSKKAFLLYTGSSTDK